MIETIAYAVVCFVICKNCSTRDRVMKAGRGAILFFALFSAYNTLQPLLPTEIDHLLYTTVWGVLFAYAVPTEKECQVSNNCKKCNCEKCKCEKCDDEKKPQDGQTPPNFTLN